MLENAGKYPFAEKNRCFVPIGLIVDLSNVNCFQKVTFTTLPGAFAFSWRQIANEFPGVPRNSDHFVKIVGENRGNEACIVGELVMLALQCWSKLFRLGKYSVEVRQELK